MVDLSDNGSDSEEMTNRSPDRASSSGAAKTCADCGTSKTPLWRGGPAGPKSLCNACGIRSRKRRRALLGLSNKEDRKPKKITNNSPTCNSESEGSSGRGIIGNDKLGDSLKRKLVALGKEVVLQKPRSTMFYQRKRLGEVEQAALLLMSLSCGSVFA